MSFIQPQTGRAGDMTSYNARPRVIRNEGGTDTVINCYV
jgi:hypothetical protein